MDLLASSRSFQPHLSEWIVLSCHDVFEGFGKKLGSEQLQHFKVQMIVYDFILFCLQLFMLPFVKYRLMRNIDLGEDIMQITKFSRQFLKKVYISDFHTKYIDNPGLKHLL